MSSTVFSHQHRYALLEAELEALFKVGQVLGCSLNLQQILHNVLQVLHEQTDMQHGMVTLRDHDGDLSVSALYAEDKSIPIVRYRAGEGIVGTILQNGQPIVIERVANEPRFLGRLGLYNPELPFIGVPIRVGEEDIVGVLVAQPRTHNDGLLAERARFLEMVAQLIAQSVRLAAEAEQERQYLVDERDRLRRVVRSSYGMDSTVKGHGGFENVVGCSPAMQRVFELVRQVAKWNTTVLIRGESGTGKELIANAIHYNSPRNHGEFIKVNCAALPENLLESELFGHEKGAFSGAINQHKGRFERADGGTLFLDEIGEIPSTFQAKLLRVLQEGEFERVGGSRTLKVDVRIITATSVDLETQVEMEKFREDLYYRLNVMPIVLPPLRERMEDIPDLAKFLVSKIAKKQGRKLEITESALQLLMRHQWPGNVRELENRLERAAIMTEGDMIDRFAVSQIGLAEEISSIANIPLPKINLTDPNLNERERVIAALEQAGWVQAKAARLLDMTPRQIAYRIQTLNIKVRNI